MVYVLMAVIISFGIAMAVSFLLMCIPLPKMWIPTIEGTCMDLKAFSVSGGVLNMFFDIVVFAFPLPFLRHVKCTFLLLIGSRSALDIHANC
jgi:hypothetical protein